MKLFPSRLFATLVAGGCLAASQSLLLAADPPRAFLRHPDVHGSQIVFTAEGDLWLSTIQGGPARRLTSHPGTESYAHFSPDGQTIAFSAQYDGGLDVYTMAAEGGEPRRLTFDPNGAVVIGWTPDGKNVLFRAYRPNPNRGNRLFSVPAAGGMPKELPIPRAEHASMSQDGRRVAFVPISAEWQHWLRYRGGEADDVWLTDLVSHKFERLTTDPGIDTTPVWVGSRIYFVSERDGFSNLYRMDPDGRHVVEVTHYTDYPVRYPSTDGKLIIYQHGPGLAFYDEKADRVTELDPALTSDRIHAREHRIAAMPWVNRFELGPTGKRLFVEARGQILSVPVENGDWRAMASQPGSRSRWAAWSPDGKQMAFISDRSGEDAVWIIASTGVAAPRQLSHGHKGLLEFLVWSPDGKRLAVSDREESILLVDAVTGEMTKVDQSPRGGSYDAVNYSYRFSPDGKWLAYNRTEVNWNDVAYLFNIEAKQRVPVSDPEVNSGNPAFDPTGKYLYFLQDRQFDPSGSGASHFFSFDRTARVTMVTLAAATPSPFLPEDEEEGGATAGGGAAGTGKGDASASKPSASQTAHDAGTGTSSDTGAKPAPLPDVKVDLDGLRDRVINVPLAAGHYHDLTGLDGRFLVMNDSGPGTPTQLFSYDLKKKQSTAIVDRLDGYQVSFDHKKILIVNGRDASVADLGPGPLNLGSGRVDLSSLELVVDPEQEWKQIFDESWRIARDFFYDPNMHGIDWSEVKRRYSAELAMVGDRSDLNQILGDMIAELNVGHAYVGGGDISGGAPAQAMGYLGADFEPAAEKNSYKITKLYPGDGFDLDARSPLLQPGLNVHVGDYILAVAGQPVRTDQSIQALLIGAAGRVVTLTVNSKPSLDGAREIRIRPLADESQTRYYAWVESRRQYVLDHGGDRIAYLHIPDMESGGLREFAKHYYASLQQDGIIYDVRDNGGGYISSMLLLQMSSRPYSYFKPRYGLSWTRQDWAFGGYSTALCNAFSGSNAEEFCDAFQRLQMGPVIGTRTWGGEVGSGGGYSLIDGGRIFIPNYGEWTPDGKWVIEGKGVVPDDEVENDPASVLAGRDPQLDRAIEYLKDQIARHPVPHPEPPPFPNKAYHPHQRRGT